MRNPLVFFLLIFIAGCSSSPIKNSKTGLTFDAVRDILSSSPSRDEIASKFGQPAEIEKKDNKERWRYPDPGTKFERIQFVFIDSKLVQLYWYPLPNETDMKIDAIFARYPTGYFKPIDVRKVSHDSFDTETTYANESTMSILHDDLRKEVEVVVWYVPKNDVLKKANPVTAR